MATALNISESIKRVRLEITGVVQGVGFRPFVYAAAVRFDLKGFVGNDSSGVFIEVEGIPSKIVEFQGYLQSHQPPLAHITSIVSKEVEPRSSNDFVIVESQADPHDNTFVSPDVSICDDCLRELFDENDRRYYYPFINCTNCGPRFTITKDVPYDRLNTTMRDFQMCELCQIEYDDPLNRRFHAQPNACGACGPAVTFVRKDHRTEIKEEAAIAATKAALANGEIVAIKGIGGFHLACDAKNDGAIKTLRERKGRVDKPFAIMVKDLETAGKFVEIDESEADALTEKQRPIVLLREKTNDLSSLIAPGNSFLGVMLPYSPLHFLLFDTRLDALVMTSGNFSNEPIVIDNAEALRNLSKLTDSFLIHDRDIHVPCDDSVVRVVETDDSKRGSVLPYRRSRGFAPFPVELPFKVPPVLALGGELKATFCLAKDNYAFMSQHIGNMENLETLEAFERSVGHMKKLFRIEPEIVVGDMHPNYLSTNWAGENLAKIAVPGAKFVKVQHHHAHIASVMAENQAPNEPVIGFAFDGTGYGTDGAIWGGEVLLADYQGFQRLAHLKYVPLAGGDTSIRKPYRTALGHLWAAGIKWDEKLPCVASCPPNERNVLLKQFENNLNTIPASSFGRLFDAVSAIAGVRQQVSYEAQAAIEFESMIDEESSDSYEFGLIEGDTVKVDPTPVVREVALDFLTGVPSGVISAKFNNATAELITQLAKLFRDRRNVNKVALSGGCFQNVSLLRETLRRLHKYNFEVLTHSKVPPNDGGLALGQVLIASHACPNRKSGQARSLLSFDSIGGGDRNRTDE